jgi:hypothetical protein
MNKERLLYIAVPGRAASEGLDERRKTARSK